MLELIGMFLIVALAGLGGWLIGSDWRKKHPKKPSSYESYFSERRKRQRWGDYT